MVSVEYEVELEIPGVMRWGEEIVETEPARPAIYQEGAHVLIVGVLSASRPEGIAEVRISDDILLVEVDSVGCMVPCNVVIKTINLQLFDANT